MSCFLERIIGAVIRIITAHAVGIRHRRLARPSERVSSRPWDSSTSRSASSSGILAGLRRQAALQLRVDEDRRRGPAQGHDGVRAVGQGPRRRGAAGRDLQGHARGRRPLRRDRLDLSHWFVAGREASGPRRRMMKPRSRYSASASSKPAKSCCRSSCSGPARAARRAAAGRRRAVQQDPDLRPLILLARDHGDRVAVEDLQQLLVREAEQGLQARGAHPASGYWVGVKTTKNIVGIVAVARRASRGRRSASPAAWRRRRAAK